MSVPAIGDERVLITAAGYEQRCRELASLRNEERRRLSGLLREARTDGDLDDNPTLVELLDEQAQLERRIATPRGIAALEVISVRPAPSAIAKNAA